MDPWLEEAENCHPSPWGSRGYQAVSTVSHIAQVVFSGDGCCSVQLRQKRRHFLMQMLNMGQTRDTDDCRKEHRNDRETVTLRAAD